MSQASTFIQASLTQGFHLSGFLFGAVRPQSGDTVSCPQLLHMWDANARAVRNRARYVRDGAGSLDWGLPRTRHNGDVARVGRPIPQGTTGVLEEEQYLSGAVGVSWLRDGQSWKPLLVHPSPSRPLLKMFASLHDSLYSYYIGGMYGLLEATEAGAVSQDCGLPYGNLLGLAT